METQTLRIQVLWPNYFEDCELCIERLVEALREMNGMARVTVSRDRGAVEVTYDKDLLTFERIKSKARSIGVTVEERFRHDIIPVEGLDCPDCASKLETSVRRMRGVAWASLSYATSKMIVEYEPQVVDVARIAKRIRDMGYDVTAAVPEAGEVRRVKTRKEMRLVLTVTSGALFLIALGLETAGAGRGLIDPLFLASAVAGGVYAARTALLGAKNLTLDTNFLMTVAAIGALWLGDYSEAAAVMFLFSLGSTLEARTADKTRRSIRGLIQAFPTHAAVRREGVVVEVPIAEVEIGEVVLVKPGEKMPVDGTIVGGESALDEAPITGESIPREKRKGDIVFAGSINGRGALEVRTTATVEDNTLVRIVHLVEETQACKAPSQRFTERFGRYYTPIVIGLAALLAVLGPLVFGGGYSQWLERSLILLVVSCPCALVISTPVAIVAAIGNAARSGVLIKGGAHLEALGEVSVVAFDKTGTLTSGKLSVCDVVAFGQRTVDQVLRVAAAVETRSEHSLADAIIERASELGSELPVVSFFEAWPGKGARAVVEGEVFYVGNRRLMEEVGICVPDAADLAAMTDRGCSLVYLAGEKEAWGAIGATDTPRTYTADALIELRSAGITRTVVLTGDTDRSARVVASELAIDEVHAELLPQDKLDIIRDISRRSKVAMVGDGINDAPALAAADVGVAMGGAGSHAAIEAADVALMSDEIVMLPYAIRLSRRARRIIRQNLVIALTAAGLLVCGALFRWVSLATGVLGHEGSALLVIANSMRLIKRTNA